MWLELHYLVLAVGRGWIKSTERLSPPTPPFPRKLLFKYKIRLFRSMIPPLCCKKLKNIYHGVIFANSTVSGGKGSKYVWEFDYIFLQGIYCVSMVTNIVSAFLHFFSSISVISLE